MRGDDNNDSLCLFNSIRNGINSFNPRKKLSGKALAGKNVKKLRSKEHAQLTHDHGTKRHSQDSSPGRQFPLTTVSLWGSTSWKDLDISYNRLQSTCWVYGLGGVSVTLKSASFIAPFICSLLFLGGLTSPQLSGTRWVGWRGRLLLWGPRLSGWCRREDKTGRVGLARWGGKRGWTRLPPRSRGFKWLKILTQLNGRCEREEPTGGWAEKMGS